MQVQQLKSISIDSFLHNASDTPNRNNVIFIEGVWSRLTIKNCMLILNSCLTSKSQYINFKYKEIIPQNPNSIYFFIEPLKTAFEIPFLFVQLDASGLRNTSGLICNYKHLSFIFTNISLLVLQKITEVNRSSKAFACVNKHAKTGDTWIR